MKKINQILKEVLQDIGPSEEDLKTIENSLKEFVKKLEKKIKALKINAEVFVGGSYAKDTMIRRDNYDIDIFVRFDAENKKDISSLTRVALKDFNVKVIHGSRDYFQIEITPQIFFEIIPVVKIKNPKEARNITDLSYSHVRYIKNRVKSKKILDEVKLAKVFCYANGCYGAESYISGFSGYALELLVYYYGGFVKFIQAMTKIKEKLIIDIEKDYKNKYQVMMDINSSKLKSPVVLIDPTYKQRNAAAALSKDTFKKFQKVCGNFLKNPSIEAFKIKKIDFEKIKKDAGRKGFEFILLKANTDRQAGDIAGSKLLKFFRHLEGEIGNFFEIKNKGFEYHGKSSAIYFFVVKNKGEILHNGPIINDINNVEKFKKEHAKVFIKNHKVYAREKIDFNIKRFVEIWKGKNKKRMNDMSIKELKF